MSSEDITFCGYSKCPNKKCERHQSNIKNFRILHSFAYFDDCPTHKQLVDDLRTAISDCED